MKYFKLMVGLSLLVCGTSLYADTIFVDGKQISVESELKNATNYVPLRFVAEELGATVTWQKPHVIVKKDNTTIQLTIDSHDVLVNNKKYSISAVPYILNNYTYVPLRFISEQLGCDVSYSTDKIVRITSAGKTPPAIPEYVDTKEYTLSSDKLWSFNQEYLWGNHNITIKNMTTGATKEIFSNRANSSVDWVNNNLIISALNEGRSRKLMLYSPTTDKLEVLVNDLYDFHINIPELNAILYFTNGTIDGPKTQYHIYHIQDRKSETLTRDAFYKILEKYAPSYITLYDSVSSNKLWSAFIDRSTDNDKDVVTVKDLSTYKLKTVYTAPYDSCHIEWLNDNLIISKTTYDSSSDSTSNITMLYNPKTDKLTTILENTSCDVYLKEPNTILYITIKPNKDGTEQTDFFMYAIDTNRSEQISKEQYHNLQETYLGHLSYDLRN